MKIRELKPMDMEEFPRVLAEGILYISEECELAAHSCCCGCGEDVITPLNPSRWRLFRFGERVSLYPSIGNWKFACRSHYWIRLNQVIPSYDLSDEEIAEVAEEDEADRVKYFSDMQHDRLDSGEDDAAVRRQRWWERLWN